MRKKRAPAGPTAEALSKKVSQHFDSANHPEIQALRVAHLAHRHRLAPHMAATIAGLVFGEAPQ